MRANKGEARPIVPERERAEVLAALALRGRVVIFDEETPHAIISAVQPDVLVKGADWGPDNIVGRDVVEARGGRVVRVPLSDGLFDAPSSIADAVSRPPSRRSARSS